MGDIVGQVRAAGTRVFGGKRVVYIGGMLAGMGAFVDELRGCGAERFLLIPTSTGSGPVPEGGDVEVALHDVGTTRNATEQFRIEERLFADPPPAMVAALDAFADDDTVIVGVPFFAVNAVGTLPIYGARRPEWVALEDKTKTDALLDAAGVPRPPSEVCRADPVEIEAAAARLDRGAGTVWAGDARDGFNGGAEFVRWVRDDGSRAGAHGFFARQCDRVRVAPFVEGVPCSIHGFVTRDGVAAFRPAELVTLRTEEPRGLRYAGAATYYDPPDDVREHMREAARGMGEFLRADVGFRGGFTIDGITSADGWVATECNPRDGAALSYIGKSSPDFPFGVCSRLIVERDLEDLSAAALEEYVVPAADALRWGGSWTPITARIAENRSTDVVGGERGYRAARDGEAADATILTGPGPLGGFVRFMPETTRTPSGPSIAPRAVAALAFADAELGTNLGRLAPALNVR
jgi:hypothetical protein